MTAKRGRPKLPEYQARGKMFSFRLQGDEHEKIARAAKREGMKITEWARKHLLESANNDIS